MTHAVKSSSFGATRRGYVFDDSEVVDISFPIQTIKIRSGDAIDSIQVIYAIPPKSSGAPDGFPVHGGNGGDQNPDLTLDVKSGEYINRVDVRSAGGTDGAIHGLTFYIEGKHKRVFQYGNKGGTAYPAYKAGHILAGIYGRADDGLFGIGFYWAPEVPIKCTITNIQMHPDNSPLVHTTSLDTITLKNTSDVDQVFTIKRSYTEVNTEELTTEVDLTMGVELSTKFGLGATMSISTSINSSTTWNWGESITSKSERTFEAPIRVKSGENLNVTIVGKRSEQNVPYDADVEITYASGRKATKHIQGIYRGVSVGNWEASY